MSWLNWGLVTGTHAQTLLMFSFSFSFFLSGLIEDKSLLSNLFFAAASGNTQSVQSAYMHTLTTKQQ
jgi:hypothetical protein